MRIFGPGMQLAVVLCTVGQMAWAQTFFGSIGVESAVGVERGSTALLAPVTELTQYLTLDNYGIEDVGPATASVSASVPRVLAPTDQVDLSLVLAGPGQSRAAELAAFGTGYRYAFGNGTTAFGTASFGQAMPDGPATRDFDITGEQADVALGLRRSHSFGETRRLLWSAEVRARDVKSRSRDVPVLDESLRFAIAGLRYEAGAMRDRRIRLAAAVAKGVDALGSTRRGNSRSSTPGAVPDFERVSFSAETSQPLPGRWTFNGGLIGQWSRDVLPLSQRCGFRTNAYSRGFEVSEVTGDRCIGSRLELARDLTLPAPGRAWLQGFAGIDGGRIGSNAGSRPVDGWSSLSVGVRALAGGFVGEVSLTRTLDRPDVAGDGDEDRLWVRAALRF